MATAVGGFRQMGSAAHCSDCTAQQCAAQDCRKAPPLRRLRLFRMGDRRFVGTAKGVLSGCNGKRTSFFRVRESGDPSSGVLKVLWKGGKTGTTGLIAHDCFFFGSAEVTFRARAPCFTCCLDPQVWGNVNSKAKTIGEPAPTGSNHIVTRRSGRVVMRLQNNKYPNGISSIEHKFDPLRDITLRLLPVFRPSAIDVQEGCGFKFNNPHSRVLVKARQ